MVLAPWLLALAVFSRLTLRPATLIAGLLGLYLPALFVAVAGIYYWAIPFHYPIAATYAVLLVVMGALAWDDVRTVRPRLNAVAAAAPPPAPPLGQQGWTLIAVLLFLYALPYIHNLNCIEVPFSSGFDLAVLYLGLPALVVAIFGGRWLGARLGLGSARAGTLLAGAALFLWIIFFGQGYIVLANALMTPRQPVVYEGVVVDKLKTGANHVLRVRIITREIVSMEVNEHDYARLDVGDRVARSMALGALQIPYIDQCRWLPSTRRGGT